MMLDNVTAGSDKVARIEAYDANSKKILASVNVHRNQFAAPFQYQNFEVFFQASASHNLELRMWWTDTSYVRVDHVILKP